MSTPEFNPQPGEMVKHKEGEGEYLVVGTVFWGDFGECRYLMEAGQGEPHEIQLSVLSKYYEYA